MNWLTESEARCLDAEMRDKYLRWQQDHAGKRQPSDYPVRPRKPVISDSSTNAIVILKVGTWLVAIAVLVAAVNYFLPVGR